MPIIENKRTFIGGKQAADSYGFSSNVPAQDDPDSAPMPSDGSNEAIAFSVKSLFSSFEQWKAEQKFSDAGASKHTKLDNSTNTTLFYSTDLYSDGKWRVAKTPFEAGTSKPLLSDHSAYSSQPRGAVPITLVPPKDQFSGRDMSVLLLALKNKLSALNAKSADQANSSAQKSVEVSAQQRKQAFEKYQAAIDKAKHSGFWAKVLGVVLKVVGIALAVVAVVAAAASIVATGGLAAPAVIALAIGVAALVGAVMSAACPKFSLSGWIQSGVEKLLVKFLPKETAEKVARTITGIIGTMLILPAVMDPGFVTKGWSGALELIGVDKKTAQIVAMVMTVVTMLAIGILTGALGTMGAVAGAGKAAGSAAEAAEAGEAAGNAAKTAEGAGEAAGGAGESAGETASSTEKSTSRLQELARQISKAQLHVTRVGLALEGSVGIANGIVTYKHASDECDVDENKAEVEERQEFTKLASQNMQEAQAYMKRMIAQALKSTKAEMALLAQINITESGIARNTGPVMN